MADVPMPPYLRRIQQGYLWQKVALPTAIGFGGSLVLQGCLSQGIENIGRACTMAAVNAWILSLITSWLQGHSPGSASFKSDGTNIPAVPKLKEMADNVIAIQTAAADPTIPQIQQTDANRASNVVDKISAEVSLNNAIIKSTLENAEVKNDVSK